MQWSWTLPIGWLLFLPTALGTALTAGAAKRVITPEHPVYLAGLAENRRSTGVHDDIYARAVAWSDGKTTVIVVGLDLIGLLRTDVQEVRERLTDQGIPTDHLLITCTHLHSGPDTIGIWGPNPTTSGVDPEYMAFLKDQIVAVVQEAYQGLRPATVAVGTAEIPDGVVENARIPGYYDREARVLVVQDAEGNAIATLVNFTAHPETLWSDSTLITADYVAHVYEGLDREVGGVTVFVNGALGGMVTVDSQGRHTFEEAARIGRAVAKTAMEAVRSAQPLEEPRLRAAGTTFQTPMTNEKFRLAAQLGVLPNILDGDQITTETHLLRLGDSVAIVTVPGELLPKLGFLLQERLRKALGTPIVFVLGLTNDELGYIIAEDEFGIDRYRYESSMSVGPKIGTDLIEAVESLIPQVQE